MMTELNASLNQRLDQLDHVNVVIDSKFEGLNAKFSTLGGDLSAGFGSIKRDNAHL